MGKKFSFIKTKRSIYPNKTQLKELFKGVKLTKEVLTKEGLIFGLYYNKLTNSILLFKENITTTQQISNYCDYLDKKTEAEEVLIPIDTFSTLTNFIYDGVYNKGYNKEEIIDALSFRYKEHRKVNTSINQNEDVTNSNVEDLLRASVLGFYVASAFDQLIEAVEKMNKGYTNSIENEKILEIKDISLFEGKVYGILVDTTEAEVNPFLEETWNDFNKFLKKNKKKIVRRYLELCNQNSNIEEHINNYLDYVLKKKVTFSSLLQYRKNYLDWNNYYDTYK